MDFVINIDFSDAAKSALPGLQPLELRRDIHQPAHPFAHAQLNDTVRIEGLRTSPTLFVAGRSWTLMGDECSLAVILGSGNGPQMFGEPPASGG